jgi:hypothetical protein
MRDREQSGDKEEALQDGEGAVFKDRRSEGPECRLCYRQDARLPWFWRKPQQPNSVVPRSRSQAIPGQFTQAPSTTQALVLYLTVAAPVSSLSSIASTLAPFGIRIGQYLLARAPCGVNEASV